MHKNIISIFSLVIMATMLSACLNDGHHAVTQKDSEQSVQVTASKPEIQKTNTSTSGHTEGGRSINSRMQ